MTSTRAPLRLARALLLLPLAACGGSSPDPAAASATPFLWRVTGPSGSGWLYGTMHVSDPRATTLPPVLEEALTAAASLHTEIEPGLAAAALLHERGNLPPGTRLKERLPPQLHQRLIGYLESRRLRGDEFERFRPWFATLMLGQIDAVELLRHGPPLDDLLRSRALAAGKSFSALETVEEQVAALSAGSEQEHVHLLDVALTRLESDRRTGRNRVRELFETWLRGDESALLRLRDDGLDLTDPIQAAWWDAILVQRNLHMAERADRLLRADPAAPPLIAVGTLHLVGADSVVELLRARGWQVERVR